MKSKQNKSILVVSRKDILDLAPRDMCYYYPRFIYDPEIGKANLFIRGAQTARFFKLDEDPEYAWIMTTDATDAIKVRRIQLVKPSIPEGGRVA